MADENTNTSLQNTPESFQQPLNRRDGEDNDGALGPLRSFFDPLSTAQKVLFGLVTVFLISLVGFLLYWASRPDYALLFGSLNPQTTQEIVNELKDEGTAYRLESDGTAIMVPRNKVYDLRLRFATQGATGTQEFKGYELFDDQTLGMTDFMQKVNMRRALEGELSKTISSMTQIDYARVMLNIPTERSPFSEDKNEPTSSVYLTLNAATKLTEQQVIGIQSLVAGSVEGLTIENVTLIDQKGTKLSQNTASDSQVAVTDAQMKHQQQTENYLTSKSQSMLDQVLGPGNAVVRLTTEHDFDKIERQSKIFDPDSRFVKSEELNNQRSNDRVTEPLLYDEYIPQEMRGQTVDTESNESETTSEVKNYDLNTTTEKYEKPVGEISRISVSVLVNYKRSVLVDSEGQDSVAYEPRTEQEITEIENVISSAIGIKRDRGDVVTITQTMFDNSAEEYLMRQQEQYERQKVVNQFIRWTLIILAFLGSVGVLFFLYRRSVEEVQEDPIFLQQDAEGNLITQGDLEDQIEFDDAPPELDPEIEAALRRKRAMIDKIKDFVMNNPEESATLIRTWMKQKKKPANAEIPKP